jgi:uncharacterized membrane protein
MGCDHRREPPDESPAGTRDFGRLYASLPEEAEAIGWYEQRAAIEIDFKRPPPMGQAGSDSFKPLSMALEIAILSFAGVNSAAEAFAAARERSSAGASWPREVGFVEHHADGHLVLRGTFAGHYVDVDEALHVSERGAAEGWAAGAAIGALLGPLGFAVGLVAGGAIGSQLAKPSESDPEPQPLSDRLRIAVPRSGSAIVLIAEAHDIDELLAATRESGAHALRKALTAGEAAALRTSLDASPAASPGPARQGEEAAEAAEAASRDRPAT